MVFSTPIFLFGFLPLFLAAYYVAPVRWGSWLILTASCGFYAWWRADVLLVVLTMTVTSYAAGWGAIRLNQDWQRRWSVRLGVACNLLILGIFKYAVFVAANLSWGLEASGRSGITIPDIILPIGLSFLTFQSISYIIDVSRGDAPPARRLSDFLAFSTLFPQLIAGPVLRYKDLAHQFEARKRSLAQFAIGFKRFVTGLAMKLIVADSVAPLADRMFALDTPTAAEAWLGALAYSIQLLFDFAGYSSMAIGLGLMIGFRFMENFDRPYTSRSITEFWRRWHISLSSWLRDYLYIPLGGNRGGKLRTYWNLLLTMVLGGIWHGANWTFVIWGAWHGGLMAIERALGAKSRGTVWPASIAWPLTMVFVLLGWVVFRAESVEAAFDMYGGMFGAHGLAMRPENITLMKPTELIFLAIGLILSTAPRLKLPSGVTDRVVGHLRFAGSAALMAICFVVIQARTESPFLYFQF
jgi:alginate O-acetyltransferase complex protein AlgI